MLLVIYKFVFYFWESLWRSWRQNSIEDRLGSWKWFSRCLRLFLHSPCSFLDHSYWSASRSFPNFFGFICNISDHSVLFRVSSYNWCLIVISSWLIIWNCLRSTLSLILWREHLIDWFLNDQNGRQTFLLPKRHWLYILATTRYIDLFIDVSWVLRLADIASGRSALVIFQMLFVDGGFNGNFFLVNIIGFIFLFDFYPLYSTYFFHR